MSYIKLPIFILAPFFTLYHYIFSHPPFSPSRSLLGRLGEYAAARHYKRRGNRILARNWKWRSGEIDLIVFDGEALRFVEVKTRHAWHSNHSGSDYFPFRGDQVRNLFAGAALYHRSNRRLAHLACNFDGVEVFYDETLRLPWKMLIYANVFETSESGAMLW